MCELFKEIEQAQCYHIKQIVCYNEGYPQAATDLYRHNRTSVGTNGWDAIHQHLQALSISWLF